MPRCSCPLHKAARRKQADEKAARRADRVSLISLLRQLRYWLGYRLLRPHLDRYWRHYDEMSGAANDNEDARINCAYITIGLHYAAGQHERRHSAKHPTTWEVN